MTIDKLKYDLFSVIREQGFHTVLLALMCYYFYQELKAEQLKREEVQRETYELVIENQLQLERNTEVLEQVEYKLENE